MIFIFSVEKQTTTEGGVASLCGFKNYAYNNNNNNNNSNNNNNNNNNNNGLLPVPLKWLFAW